MKPNATEKLNAAHVRLLSELRQTVQISPFAAGDLAKAVEGVGAAPSRQGDDVGERPHPFNMSAVSRLLVADTHHVACICAKADATVGLGLKNEKISERLDELTNSNFVDLLNQVAQDYWSCGNGYWEVVRDGGEISGLHHIPAPSVAIDLEDAETYDFHYVVRGNTGTERRFARFGDLEDFAYRRNLSDDEVSEVIHWRSPSPLSRWYGVPSWLAAVPCIELVMAILQHNHDFFHNRGVPEFLLFLLGGKVDKPDLDKIDEGLKAQIGPGNSHKSMVVNLPNPNIEAKLEKLAMDGGNLEGNFESMLDTLALRIVSAHRVPPLLAGIQIPGKLGANNELPNALVGFQTLVVGPGQVGLAKCLGTTLGHPKLGLRKGIRGAKSFEMNTILEQVDMQAVRETSATRTPVGASEKARGGAKTAAKKKAVKKAIAERFERAEKKLAGARG